MPKLSLSSHVVSEREERARDRAEAFNEAVSI
jgi:hypothetical protein